MIDSSERDELLALISTSDLRALFARKQNELRRLFDAMGADRNINDPWFLSLIGAQDSQSALAMINDRNAQLEAIGRHVVPRESRAA